MSDHMDPERYDDDGNQITPAEEPLDTDEDILRRRALHNVDGLSTAEREAALGLANPTVVVHTTMVLPTGLDLETDVGRVNYPHWSLYVRWQGHLGWTVTTVFPQERLSVKGRKWAYYVPPRNRRFYYFPTYDEALVAACDAVDSRRANGRTWADVMAFEAKTEAILKAKTSRTINRADA